MEHAHGHEAFKVQSWAFLADVHNQLFYRCWLYTELGVFATCQHLDKDRHAEEAAVCPIGHRMHLIQLRVELFRQLLGINSLNDFQVSNRHKLFDLVRLDVTNEVPLDVTR